MGSNQSRCDNCTPAQMPFVAQSPPPPPMNRPIPVTCKPQPHLQMKREPIYYQQRHMIYAATGRQPAAYPQQAYGCQPNMQPMRKAVSCCYTAQPPQCQPHKMQQHSSSAPPSHSHSSRPYSCHQPSISCPPQMSYQPPPPPPQSSSHRSQHQSQRHSVAPYSQPPQSYYYNNCSAQYQYYNNSNCSSPYNTTYNCNRCPSVY